MSVLGHGIDLIENERVERVWKQHPDRFLSRILTPLERALCEKMKNPVPHIAGRFAAKEAVLKMIGTGWRGQIAWTDIEIENDPAGQPRVTTPGAHIDRRPPHWHWPRHAFDHPHRQVCRRQRDRPGGLT
ncbi:MAG: holo-ACP synthase [Planctomycetes bacterium]|nr:holo-ACP synthase [Planctomycetota bacterium]